MSNTRIQNKIAEFKKDANFIPRLTSALDNLKYSGVIEFLYILSSANLISGENVHQTAYQAARSAGYAEALNDLQDFIEKFITGTDASEKPRMDFNSINKAVESGHMTKEEAHAIRTNTKPNYIVSKPSFKAGSGSTGN